MFGGPLLSAQTATSKVERNPTSTTGMQVEYGGVRSTIQLTLIEVVMPWGLDGIFQAQTRESKSKTEARIKAISQRHSTGGGEALF